ncbi:osiris 10a [Lycorma delicatula]|uniref:osiris 10a n=1 Tax=Lycorma delicatula TaxID=130591 RepID=UPI003F513B66
MHKVFRYNCILWTSLMALVVVPYYSCESIMRPHDSKDSNEPSDPSYIDEVGHCLREGGGVTSCVAAGAFVYLETASHKKSLSLTEDLELYENDVLPQETRTNLPLEVDGEATDFHTLLEASSKFLQRRTLRWSLGSIYPGLEVYVGPTNAGPPILQFLLDPRQAADDRRLSTGRLLVKRAVLPYILGLKLNLLTIMPLVLAGLIFLTKKAFLFSKFAFLFMTMTGFSSLTHLTSQQNVVNHAPGYGLNAFENYYRDYTQPSYNREENLRKKFVWEERERKMT